MRAESDMNPERDTETLVSVYEKKGGRLICWGGMNMMTGKPYIVFTPPHGIPFYSPKQEKLFKTFLLAAHIEYTCAGVMDYSPEKVFDAYKIVFPREHYPYGTEQTLPEFDKAG